jgi:UDP-N-acetylglucosamine transferase subunit ALG13|nr:glycosyltransferase [uncultured Acetatifactor sp.]
MSILAKGYREWTILIFVTVGSRQYPFDRLFKRLDDLYEDGILTEPMFAQVGTSTYKPRHYAYQNFISPDEFLKKVNEADIVVSHGASGSIMKALNAGKKVIAVTRLEKYGEHINDHQIQNNDAFSSNGYVLMADLELEDLGECFQKLYDGTDGLIPWENKDPMSIVKMIDRFIQENW